MYRTPDPAGPRELRSPAWWKRAVVYQIYPRSFADSNGDGVGDLRGILHRLDHLADLGIDAVWLSPVLKSPQIDNGYDISDYTDVDPLFGSLDDLDELIEGLHRRRIKFVMDLVVNHTSDQHQWFRESRDVASARSDWYIWRPPGRRPDGAPGPPNDWQATFGGPAWTFDDTRGEYFLHLFSPHQPDLNWDNPAVRGAIHDVMRLWIERGVDGFRMDVINLISKPPGLPDVGGDPPIGHGAVNGPRLEEFLTEMNREVELDEQNIMTVGEMPGATIELARRLTDPDRHALNMVFTFEHVELDRSDGGSKWDFVEVPLPRLKQNLASWQRGLADVGWNSLYLDNHDQPRLVSRFGDDSPAHRQNCAKTLATALLLHRGTPFVYQGSEIGAINPRFEEIDQFVDVESVDLVESADAHGVGPDVLLDALRQRSRDNARTPMRWNSSPHGGFTTGTPWLDIAEATGGTNVEDQRADPNSVLHHYRALIELRHRHVALTEGGFELLLPDDPAIWAFRRPHEDETVLVVANCSSHEVAVPDVLGASSPGTILISTHRADDTILRPWESRVVQLTNRSVDPS